MSIMNNEDPAGPVAYLPAYELDSLRAALAELVALKDMKDRLTELHEMGHGTDYGNYHKRLPLAWAAARAALSAQPS